MPVYHQMGHHSANLLTVPQLNNYRGAILSPVNEEFASIESQIASATSIPGFRLIFDPQLYNPNTERGCLPTWSYFPQDVETADRTSNAWWSGIVNNLAGVCISLNVDAVCSPADVPRHFADEYYNLMVNVCAMLIDQLSETRIPVLQTAIVKLSDLSQPNRVQSIASVLSRTRANEIFLVFVSDVPPRRELSDVEELKGAMRLIAELENSGLEVLVGYSSTDVILWKLAGATSCATGKHFNLRRFTLTRFEEPTQDGGGQLPYWVEEGFIAYLRESDVIRVNNANLISGSSQVNPFAVTILTQIQQVLPPGQPRPAWLGISWRQYLYWFADIEHRISKNQINISQMLVQVENNWLYLDNNNILMEEPRNNGGWIRPWRRALAEFMN